MNQMTRQKDTAQQPLQAGPAKATPVVGGPLEDEKPTLNAADAHLLYKALVLNSAPVARQSDLIELNNRIVKLFGTLNEGLAATQAKKAMADRNELVARLDAMETSVNRMEGAFRIEFEPLLRQALAEVVSEQTTPKRGGFLRLAGWAVLAAAGVTLGVLFHEQIQTLAAQIIAAAPLPK